MPEIYGRTLASVPGSEWDFTTFVPDAVIVNLGTNDWFSRSFNSSEFTATYVSLAYNISARYGPDISLFLACGPMTNGYCTAVKDVISILATNPAAPAAYFLDQTDLGLTLGCCGHPSASDDEVIAVAAAEFIMSTLDWI